MTSFAGKISENNKKQGGDRRLRSPPNLGFLFCSEETVSRIAQSGKDISILVEATVQGGDKDVNIGVGLRHTGNPFGGADDCHELDVLASAVLQ